MMKRIFAGFLLAPVSIAAAELQTAQHYVAQELADCSAFYFLLGDLPGAQEVQESPIAAEENGWRALQAAADFSSRETALVRLRLALLNIREGLSGSWDNALVFRRRFSSCGALLDAPAARISYWLEQDEPAEPSPERK
jgi:hypothetical protein